MGWKEVSLHDVNPNLAPIAENDYTFQLLGANYDERDPARINVRAAIVSDGEFTGRRVFFSYPDPDKQDWSPRVLKRLEQAIGVDSMPGEDPVGYLNRATGNRFASNIKHREYTPEGGSKVVRAELNIFGVRAAA